MPEICYACLSAPGVTRDHVPPRCFFPVPVPVNLITVACCRECNEGNSGNDDYVRAILATHIHRSPAGDWIWEEKVVRGYFPRNPKTVDELLASSRDAELVIDGIGQEAVAFSPDWERLEAYFTRLTKGLLRHHYPDYDYSSSKFSIRFIESWHQELRQLENIRYMLKPGEIGDKVFQYRHGLTESGQSGLWMLVFYGAIMVLAHHTNLPPA